MLSWVEERSVADVFEQLYDVGFGEFGVSEVCVGFVDEIW